MDTPVKTVNMHEAKTHLSRLVEAAVNGEPFVIARAGKPLVKVEALEVAPAAEPKLFGFLEGVYPPWPEDVDFDRFMEDDIRELFEGREDGTGLWQEEEERRRRGAA